MTIPPFGGPSITGPGRQNLLIQHSLPLYSPGINQLHGNGERLAFIKQCLVDSELLSL